MKLNLKAALFIGAVSIVAGTDLAFAQMDGPPPPDGPMQGLMHREGRLADRLLAEFDLNHDGKITHTEFNTVIANRYGKTVHGGKGLSLEQFMALHMPEFQKHTGDMFHRIDGKGDGKITLDEFAAPQRAHFEMMDRDGTGLVSCGSARGSASGAASVPFDDEMQPRSGRGQGGQAVGGRGAGGFGKARFCEEADVNKDGKVTRAEFDQSIAHEFSMATKGTSTMTAAQFYATELARFQDMNTRMYKRLDKDRDGLLSLQEYASPEEKLFARLDRSHTGVITEEDMRPRFANRGERGQGGGKSARRG
jgi:Ca2+-binding EF-hand superfamily protein